ncbi:MAG: HesA/MoeB/ThiF family protein [Planctomycetes bacterium]|nr:HesA/MoeB/ThiF family protein [Planctomycetota bacterium]
MTSRPLTDEQKAIYEWQMTVAGFGQDGQQKLANTTALISRCGGLGSPLAYSLAAAGFGKLIIAHGGNVKHSDLNRQILMTDASLGTARIESIKKKLHEFNPRMEVEGIASNITEENAGELVSKADIVFDCAPLFTERFALNRQCVEQNKPMIEAAMHSLEGQVMTIIPGQSACLACLYPEDPPHWKRQFPVFGAVSALAAQIAAMEGIKVISGIGETLAGTLLYYDTADMSFQKIAVKRNPNCPVCSNI